MAPRIALIHAVTVAIDPVGAAMRELWPDAFVMNLLDDSLSTDRAGQEELTPEMHGRIADLGDYALRRRADGVLYTCSAFGAAIAGFAERAPVPVLKPNEAMFEAALAAGDRIGMLATFAPSIASMTEEFEALAASLGRAGARLESHCVPEAMAALRAGDGESHDRRLAEAAGRFSGFDVVLLAQFSTARAKAAVSAVIGQPALTSPHSAVAKLRSLVLPAI
ncbi:aspartate/glutamate racemase family protein [Bosea sp. (in: a-proteobacteria)]|uniref:aspartate/glutamate racemase family protein n=1 Tax=Bosea sp. (in: a-proteobacteria) TaxID=1871050 RepID=UPI0026266A01|nr:aspartate/glutamate racemase family protein [Bosea sp. (in: a-proteobacteria)]MCO5091692.1 aspartate/glutamate racemase family protein [Bosea sp. (in: a-proteobacteria)]